jgi:hypothetical protein
MDDRFLKVCFPKGRLLEKFDKDFDIVEEAEKNMMLYIQIAKEIEFLTLVRKQNKYVRRFENNTMLEIKGRRKQTYDEYTWMLDMISKDQAEYDEHVKKLDDGIMEYKRMVNEIVNDTVKIDEIKPEEEFIE